MALSESDPEGAACVKAFRRGLQELRWEEGVNLQIDVRWASRSTQKEHAEELLAIAPKVAVAHGTPAVHAVRNRLSTLPIVFVQVADPVQQGIVANLSHPGGNITGFMGFEFTIAGKWLQILKKLRLKLLTWQ